MPCKTAMLTMLLWQDAYAVLSTRCATEDAQPGINSTSVVTALSFWDYSLLTTVRMTARLIFISAAVHCIAAMIATHYLSCRARAAMPSRQPAAASAWPLAA